jgi:hypothetical protein
MTDKFIKRSSRTAARRIGDETMVLAVADSVLFSLNETASLLWESADGVTALRDIVSREIIPRFDIDGETAYRDALELVEELHRQGIFEVAETPLESK